MEVIEMKNLVLRILILLSCVATPIVGSANENIWDPKNVIDHLSVINLRVNKVSVSQSYNYPGLGGQHFRKLDCLVLMIRGSSIPNGGIVALAKSLVVEDGDGILFNQDGRTINRLKPLAKGHQIVFPIVDLGKYVTGIRVRTNNPSLSLGNLVTQHLGYSIEIAGLQVIRGCEVR
jgi:hypothetical protein